MKRTRVEDLQVVGSVSENSFSRKWKCSLSVGTPPIVVSWSAAMVNNPGTTPCVPVWCQSLKAPSCVKWPPVTQEKVEQGRLSASKPHAWANKLFTQENVEKFIRFLRLPSGVSASQSLPEWNGLAPIHPDTRAKFIPGSDILPPNWNPFLFFLRKCALCTRTWNISVQRSDTRVVFWWTWIELSQCVYFGIQAEIYRKVNAKHFKPICGNFEFSSTEHSGPQKRLDATINGVDDQYDSLHTLPESTQGPQIPKCRYVTNTYSPTLHEN